MNEEIGHKVFNEGFVDEIRHVRIPQDKYKSSFITQAYKDKAQGLLTYAPTVQRSSKRTIIHITAQELENFVLFLRDIVQAYTQTKEEMKRIV